jgi:hypothetical protein
MTNQFKAVAVEKVVDIFLPAGIKVVETEDVITFPYESFAEM